MLDVVKKNDGIKKKESFTSLELVELINQFREQESNKTPLLHKNLMAVIRDEFEEEIRELKIQRSSQTVAMPNGGTREQPVFVLNLQQARQVLVRESKFVRKAVIKYIDELEKQIQQIMSKKDNLLLNVIHANGSEVNIALALNKYENEYVKPLELRSEQQERKLIEQAPLVELSNNLLSSDDNISVGDMAKILKNDGVKNIGQNKLFAFLRSEKVIMAGKKVLPYQRFVNLGYFDVIEVTKPYEDELTSKEKFNIFPKSLITPQGQLFITTLVKAKYNSWLEKEQEHKEIEKLEKNTSKKANKKRNKKNQ